jgi:hypothetical protein
MWAFGYPPEEAKPLWDKIPLDCNIVVTHTPPKYHCDESAQRRAAGCEVLRETLWRVRPQLLLCGHVHEGRGAEIVRWDLGVSNVKYKELGIQRWIDPGRENKKMSLVDLTPRSSNNFHNDAATGDWGKAEAESSSDASPQQAQDQSPLLVQDTLPLPVVDMSRPGVRRGISHVGAHLLAIPAEVLPPASRGQGGIPPSRRCDLEALSGRLGRMETCVVNAAIMTSSWPHNSGGGKKFNKPIVVDIDLPVWE